MLNKDQLDIFLKGIDSIDDTVLILCSLNLRPAWERLSGTTIITFNNTTINTSSVDQWVKNLPAMQETQDIQVQCLG